MADRAPTVLFEGAVALGADAGAGRELGDAGRRRRSATGRGGRGALTPGTWPTSSRWSRPAPCPDAGAKQASGGRVRLGGGTRGSSIGCGLRQVSDTGALGALADEVLAENPDVVQKFRDGKEGVIGFLVGQLMQKAAGAANPKVAQELLRERLQG